MTNEKMIINISGVGHSPWPIESGSRAAVTTVPYTAVVDPFIADACLSDCCVTPWAGVQSLIANLKLK